MQQLIMNLSERIDSEVYCYLESYTGGDNVIEFYFIDMDELLEHEVEEVLDSVTCPEIVEDVEYTDGNIVLTLSKYALDDLTDNLLREWSHTNDLQLREYNESRGI